MPKTTARPSVWRTVGKIFLTGLLTVLPIIVTIYFTVWMLTMLERFFGKQVLFLIPDEWYRTGMGLLVAIVVVFAMGLLMHAIVFRRLFGWMGRHWRRSRAGPVDSTQRTPLPARRSLAAERLDRCRGV